MKCIICQNKFELKRNKQQKCCSRKCNAINQNKIKSKNFIIPKCKLCGKETRRQSRAIFCSNKCCGKYQSGENNPMWQGGRKKHSEGYIYLYQPTHSNCDIAGYVLEHRYLIEKKIGRLLNKSEKVHHINGIKDDNKLENLILLKSQAEHLKEHNYQLAYRKKR